MSFASSDNGKGAAQAYWNALSRLKEVWMDVFGTELYIEQSKAKDAFQEAVAKVSHALASNPQNTKDFGEYGDIQNPEDPNCLAQALLKAADIDNLSPNFLIGIMLERLSELSLNETYEIELRYFLRDVLDDAFEGLGTRRPNVGANRHWPRLRQYLREIEEVYTGHTRAQPSMMLRNTRGGRMALNPRDPRRLTLLINPECF